MSNKDLNRIQQLINERKTREQAALKLFRPMPHQDAFFKSNALKRVIRGGNRCLGGEQEIYDPVANKSTKVSEIVEDFHVLSYDWNSKKIVTKKAYRPFIKSVDRLYRFTLSSGISFVATMGHRILTHQNQWVSTANAMETA